MKTKFNYVKRLPKDNDCGCGKPVRITDPNRKKTNIKKTIKRVLNNNFVFTVLTKEQVELDRCSIYSYLL